MVSTRLQSNNSPNDNSILSPVVLKLTNATTVGVERGTRVISTRLHSNNTATDNPVPSSSEALQKLPSVTTIRVSSTRQNNSSTNDTPVSSASELVQKCSCIAAAGCVTRSIASTHPNICHSKDVQSRTALNLMDLPREVIEKIVSYCGYKTVATTRLVNREMNYICGSLLTLTFNKLQNSMLARFHSIKAQMPRRESARRQHALAYEFDIIETIYMRLNLVHLTLGKHIEKKLIYFFPGDVLDEVYRIIHLIKVTPKLPRPYLVTDELFDLTTMAMEYFKEKLEPNLPELTYYGRDRMNYSPIRGSPTATNSGIRFDDTNSVREFSLQSVIDDDPPQSNMVLRKRIRKIKQGMRMYNSQLTSIKRELKGYKLKMADQQKTILDYATRLDENDKKNEEMSRKYSTLLQELNKCKTELQYWRSTSPLNSNQLCGACGAPLAANFVPLHNQGCAPPSAIVQPHFEAEEEVCAEKTKVDEQSMKEDRDHMCSHSEAGGSNEDSTTETSTSTEDQKEHNSASCNTNVNSSTEEADNSSNTDVGQERPLRPAKRKQVSDKPSSCKRSRGILKLRSKTIRIMK